MASADSTVFAVKGQAFRVYGWIKDSTTGNPITSLGTLSATISKDGAAGATSTNTATGVSSHNGRFYLDLTATEMDANNIGITVTSNTANQISCTIDITTVSLAEFTDHWRDQSVLRLEHAIMVPAEYIQNYTTQSNTDPYTITVRNKGNTSTLFTMTVTNDGTNEIKGEATT